jgi:hypothetical protein
LRGGYCPRCSRHSATKWTRQEKEIRKIIDRTQGKYGGLQAVTGRSLAAIPALEAPANPHADAGAHLPEAFTPS